MSSEDEASEEELEYTLSAVGQRALLRLLGMAFVDDDQQDDMQEEEEPEQEEVLTRSDDSAALEEYRARVHDQSQCHPSPSGALLRHSQSGMSSRFTDAKGSSLMRHLIPTTQTKVLQYNARAFCGRFSEDGEVFCSASQDSMIHLFGVPDFKIMRQVQARDVGWAVVDVDLSPDKRFVAYSSWSNCVHLCNVFGRYELHESLDFQPDTASTCMFGIRFSSDCRSILAGCNQGWCIMYDIERKTPETRVQGHTEDVNSVCFIDESPNLYASASDDAMAKVWDRRDSRHCVGALVGHLQGLTCVTSKKDGRYLLTNSKDHSMKLWDLRKMCSPHDSALRAVPNRVKYFDYRREGFRRSGGRMEQDHSLMTFLGHQVSVTLIRCGFSPLRTTGQRYVFTGSATGDVVVYDSCDGSQVASIKGAQSIVRDVDWHPTENFLLASSWDGTSRRFDFV